ncbi:MAG: glycosyltransferase family 4 protein [Sphingobacteriaceae bacterium]
MSEIKRLAIISTHPIQYYAPVFQLLHQRKDIAIKVFYTWGEQSEQKFDPGFNKKIEWDIPLLDGYPFEWAINTAKDPGSHHFTGIVNPHLIAQIKIWNPDALLVYGWAYQSHLQVLRYFKGKIPVFFRGDSTLLDRPLGIKSWLKKHFITWVYQHVDHAFYVGDQNRKYFLAHGLRPDQLHFAPHAVDNNRFAAVRSTEVDLLKKHLRLTSTDVLVVFAGKLETKKDPELLQRTFTDLKFPNVHLLFVGNGVLEEKLKADSLGLKNIHFLNFQNQTDMPVVYQACDLFILPSSGPGETWGLAVNEAMACGKAILVSDKVGCAADLVKPGINGAVFKAGNLDSLKEKLTQLIAHPEKLKQFGTASKTIIKDWDFDHLANALVHAVNTYAKER